MCEIKLAPGLLVYVLFECSQSPFCGWQKKCRAKKDKFVLNHCNKINRPIHVLQLCLLHSFIVLHSSNCAVVACCYTISSPPAVIAITSIPYKMPLVKERELYTCRVKKGVNLDTILLPPRLKGEQQVWGAPLGCSLHTLPKTNDTGAVAQF